MQPVGIVPDLIEPIRAARAWKSAQAWRETYLKSVFKNGIWPREKPIEARCGGGPSNPFLVSHYGEDPEHPAPDPMCACGVWGLSSLPHLFAEFGEQTGIVVGVIEMWGRIVVGEHGYRSQFARPVAIVRKDRRASKLEKGVARAYRLKLLWRFPDLTQPEDLDKEVGVWTSDGTDVPSTSSPSSSLTHSQTYGPGSVITTDLPPSQIVFQKPPRP